MKKSAVLILILDNKDGKFIILTRRASTLRNHSNQICIPGGRIENNESNKTAALRELGEELGIDTKHINVIGELQPQITSTNFYIYPFFGMLYNEIAVKINENEVAEIIKIPLGDITNLKNYKINNDDSYKIIRHKYCFTYENHFIWGVTATILKDFATKYTKMQKSMPLEKV